MTSPASATRAAGHGAAVEVPGSEPRRGRPHGIATRRPGGKVAGPDPAAASSVLHTLAPIIEQLGSAVVPAELARRGDIPIEFDGTVIAYARPPVLTGWFQGLIRRLEREFGRRLPELSRAEQKRAVRRLDEEGAFGLRGSVNQVARALELSRGTVYVYLNSDTRRPTRQVPRPSDVER